MTKPAKTVKKAAPEAPAGRGGMTGRFYCHGIGDCHLLTFPKPDGGVFRMLIDCGIHTSVSGGRETVDRIVDDIIAKTKDTGHVIDVVVGTHEHWDHNSGFLTAAEKFKQLKVGEIWLGWTEDPADPQAGRLDKFKGSALTALADAKRRLNYVEAEPDLRQKAAVADLRQGLAALLEFNFGLKGERSRSARDAIVSLSPDNVQYLEPTDAPRVIEGLPNLRIYVLGPPRSESMLKITESAAEMYGIGAAGWPETMALSDALAEDADDSGAMVTPFERDLGFSCLQAVAEEREPAEVTAIRDLYLKKDTYRRIDNDWLGISADLAMQLDDRTNNTSLVLAFEFIDTGRVLLFAADAQVGNWLSWQDLKWVIKDKDGKEKSVTGPDLLARTVFYKVGHHGSHNATLKKKGLELMVDKDLTAFIPTNKQDAAKVRWHEMPFEKLLAELQKRTSGRVIRADDSWLGKGKDGHPFDLPSGSLQDVRSEDPLWVDLELS